MIDFFCLSQRIKREVRGIHKEGCRCSERLSTVTCGFWVWILVQRSAALGSRMGSAQGIYPWVITLVMGNLMGRRFWVGRGCFFLGGRGRGRGSVRASTAESFSQNDTRFQTAPFFILYIIYRTVEVLLLHPYMLYVCDMLYVCYMSSSRALLLYVYVCCFTHINSWIWKKNSGRFPWVLKNESSKIKFTQDHSEGGQRRTNNRPGRNSVRVTDIIIRTLVTYTDHKGFRFCFYKR